MWDLLNLLVHYFALFSQTTHIIRKCDSFDNEKITISLTYLRSPKETKFGCVYIDAKIINLREFYSCRIAIASLACMSGFHNDVRRLARLKFIEEIYS